jgi:transcriptional regulator with GAF, ATPase, and Fis domain
MFQLAETVQRIAPHIRTALVTGETGTGKEAMAGAIHHLSRATGRLVTMNCSAVVETLFESELFGHVRGAFTGAISDKMGQLEYADGGTVLLDEIGDMPLPTQAKLLRVLQDQRIQRVGALDWKHVNVRVIAATNKNLRAAIARREFREDLYYRLSMVELHLPPLREREGDLELLADFFLHKWAERCGKKLAGISASASRILSRHAWPGNVRELENVIGHACMMAQGDTIEPEELPLYLLDRSTGSPETPDPPTPTKGDELERSEYALVKRALERSNWNQTRAALALGTTRERLRTRMKRYGLEWKRVSEDRTAK